MDLTEGYKELLKQRLTPKRYTHTISVAQTAAKLAGKYKVNITKAHIAGLLHDYARDLSNEELLSIAMENDLVSNHAEVLHPQILHGAVGAFLLKRDGIIDDEEILQAIRYHTTGHPDMDRLGQIIYIADYIEPGRDFPGVEKMRQVTYQNLEYGIMSGLDHTLMYLIHSAAYIHPLSIETRNRFIEKLNIKHCN